MDYAWGSVMMQSRRGLALAPILLLLVGSAASAQDVDISPSTSTKSLTSPAAVESPHRFFDSLNITLTGIEVGALLADGITTQHLLQADPYHLVSYEADPIARPFVYAGWSGQIAGGALVVSAEVGLRYLLHRKNHHRFERLLPLGLTMYGAVGAIHNAPYWSDATVYRCRTSGRC
jgi:hypothetical protein